MRRKRGGRGETTGRVVGAEGQERGGAINDALDHVTRCAAHLLPRYACATTAFTSYILSRAIRQFDRRAPIIITITSRPLAQTNVDVHARMCVFAAHACTNVDASTDKGALSVRRSK